MNLRTALVLLISGLGAIAQPALADPLTFTVTQINVPGSTSTAAVGINDASQIVGGYTDSAGNSHGFLDNSGVFTTLNFPGSTFTEATGISNVGQIVGLYSGGAFLYQNGAFSNLPIPAAGSWGGYTLQVAINDFGQIVGTTNNGRGFLYSNGQLTFLSITGSPFTALGPLFDAAHGINNSGVIAGSGYPPGVELAAGFLYSNGQYSFHFAGGGASDTYGVNNAGDYLITDTSTPTTYLVKNGVANELTTFFPFAHFPGFARGLNDSDQIVGSYSSYGFLATPVPEPTSVLLFAAGLTGVALLLRRKRAQ